MWIRGWGELQSGEVGGCEATELSRREGKSDCKSIESFWDDIKGQSLILTFDKIQ